MTKIQLALIVCGGRPAGALRWLPRGLLAGVLSLSACSGSDESSGNMDGGEPGEGGSAGEGGGSGGSSTTGGTSSKATGGTSSKATGGTSDGGDAGSPASAGSDDGGASTSGGSATAGSAPDGGEGDGGESPSGTGGAANGGAGGDPGSGGQDMGNAGQDMGTGGAGDVCGCMPFDVSWGQDGGFVAYRDTSELVPCRIFRHTREPVDTLPPSLECEQEVVACGDAFGSSDVLLAIAHPEVQAAMAEAPVLYGQDTRPVDGQVLQVTIDGALIEIGTGEIPDGIAALRDVVQTLTEQELGREPCAGVFE